MSEPGQRRAEGLDPAATQKDLADILGRLEQMQHELKAREPVYEQEDVEPPAAA